MSLWKKTILLISLTFIIVIIVLYFISQNIMLRSFIILEEQIAVRNVERIKNAIHDHIESLSYYAADWASWDDSYEFVIDLNDNYRETNLVDSTFTNLKINFLMFINTDGRVVYKRGLDLKEEVEMTVPASLLSHIKLHSVILRHDTEGFLDGLLYLPEGPVIITSHPLLTSEDEGPARGTLIMAKFLDSALLDHFSERTRLPIKMHYIKSNNMPDDFFEAKGHLSSGSSPYINARSEDIIGGYSILKDIFNKPAFILGTNMTRDIYTQGKNSVTYFILSIVLVIIVSGIIMLLYLHWLYRVHQH